MAGNIVDIILHGKDEASHAIHSAEKSLHNLNLEAVRASGGVSRLFKAGLAGAGAAFGGIAIGAYAAAKSISDTAVRLDRLSETTGATVDQMKALEDTFEEFGLAPEAADEGLVRLARAIGRGAPELKALGITTRDTVTAFKQLGEIFASSGDRAGKVAIITKLMGKELAGSAGIIDDMAADLDHTQERLKRFGVLMGDDGVQQAKKLHTALGEVHEAMEGIKTQVALAVGPALVTMSREFAEWVVKNRVQLTEFVANVAEAVPKVIELAKDLLGILDKLYHFPPINLVLKWVVTKPGDINRDLAQLAIDIETVKVAWEHGEQAARDYKKAAMEAAGIKPVTPTTSFRSPFVPTPQRSEMGDHRDTDALVRELGRIITKQGSKGEQPEMVRAIVAALDAFPIKQGKLTQDALRELGQIVGHQGSKGEQAELLRQITAAIEKAREKPKETGPVSIEDIVGKRPFMPLPPNLPPFQWDFRPPKAGEPGFIGPLQKQPPPPPPPKGKHLPGGEGGIEFDPDTGELLMGSGTGKLDARAKRLLEIQRIMKLSKADAEAYLQTLEKIEDATKADKMRAQLSLAVDTMSVEDVRKLVAKMQLTPPPVEVKLKDPTTGEVSKFTAKLDQTLQDEVGRLAVKVKVEPIPEAKPSDLRKPRPAGAPFGPLTPEEQQGFPALAPVPVDEVRKANAGMQAMADNVKHLSEAVIDVRQNWILLADSITSTAGLLDSGLNALFNGLQGGFDQVFSRITDRTQTLRSAMHTIFRSIADEALHELARVAAAKLFGFVLRLLGLTNPFTAAVAISSPIIPVGETPVTAARPAGGAEARAARPAAARAPTAPTAPQPRPAAAPAARTPARTPPPSRIAPQRAPQLATARATGGAPPAPAPVLRGALRGVQRAAGAVGAGVGEIGAARAPQALQRTLAAVLPLRPVLPALARLQASVGGLARRVPEAARVPRGSVTVASRGAAAVRAVVDWSGLTKAFKSAMNGDLHARTEPADQRTFVIQTLDTGSLVANILLPKGKLRRAGDRVAMGSAY